MIKHLFYPAKILFSILALSFMVACGGNEPEPSPGPTPPPNPTQDTKAPVITLKIQEQNVIAGVKVDIKTDQILFDQAVAATWKDDISKSCKVEVGFVGEGGGTKAIKSGDRLDEPGQLQIKVTDEAGNDSSAEIKLTRVDSGAPEISILIGEKNVVAGVKVKVDGNQLFLDNQVAASWKDDYSETLTVDVQYIPENSSTGKAIESGETLFDTGKLQITVQDDSKNKSTADIKLTAIAITGLESLMGKELTVDVPVNLLQGLTISEGLTLQKVEVEHDGQRSEIPDATKYIPEVPGSINIILTLSRTDGSTIEAKVENMTVNGIQYQAISITDIKPVDVFPQIAQIEAGDKNIYSYVEDLMVAETYVMRDMMTNYGTGKYTPEEYQQLLSRVTIGLIEEKPDDYQEYEWIGPAYIPNIYDHGNVTFKNLISLKCKQTKVMNLSGRGDGWAKNLSEYARVHPDNIFIFSNSSTKTANSQAMYKQEVFDQNVIDLCNLPNVIIFVAGGDTETEDGVNLKIIYNGAYDEVIGDGRYLYSSMANSNQDNYPNSNMRIGIGTDPQGNPDMTDSSGSLFPIGFSNSVIVSGHPILPIFRKGRYWGEDYPRNGSYYTSYVTPTIASETQLMFGLHADVKDANKLLEMIESCTADPDYISLNGQKQALQKYSPANFVKKYCMTANIPSSIGQDETVDLKKEWYKGLVFNIPGAEVKIDGQWIVYDAKNKGLIFAQNPMNLEWRLNGALLRKYGYTPSQTIQGQIITVDDQWNGLRLEKDFTIQIR